MRVMASLIATSARQHPMIVVTRHGFDFAVQGLAF